MAAIFLNGCTSAGKSSLARVLQNRLSGPHLLLGIDDAFAMCPPSLHNSGEGFYFDRDERELVRLNLGPMVRRLIHAHMDMAAAVIRRDLDLILERGHPR